MASSQGRRTIRTYWLASNLVAVAAGATLALYWVWTQGNPAQTDADSWRQARWLIWGVGLGGALLANALVANAAAALKGPVRGWAGGLLAAWLLGGALVAWLAARR